MYTYIIETQRNKIPYTVFSFFYPNSHNSSNTSDGHFEPLLFRHQPVTILINTLNYFLLSE
jgi:hypothetical protein